MRSYTYGVLPDARTLRQIVAGHIPYPMKLVGADAVAAQKALRLLTPRQRNMCDSPSGAGQGFRLEIGSAEALCAFLRALVKLYERGNDAAGDLASGILSTMDVEWV